MYTLFTDKQETFTADIKLEGASLTNSFARLIVESDDWNLVFNGDINNKGRVNIPIKKLKQIFESGTTGTMKLEVVADDTYFSPWNSDFEVETSKQVTVEVKTQNKPKLQEKSIKPKITVENVTNNVSKKPNVSKPKLFKEYISTLKRVDINLNNMRQKGNSLQRITEAFSKKHKLNNKDKMWIQSQTLKYFVKKSI
tara:strand:+ start:909 stop:1499 length:591 start_codon:yes stop_codon:yes gene_type:complete